MIHSEGTNLSGDRSKTKIKFRETTCNNLKIPFKLHSPRLKATVYHFNSEFFKQINNFTGSLTKLFYDERVNDLTKRDNVMKVVTNNIIIIIYKFMIMAISAA